MRKLLLLIAVVAVGCPKLAAIPQYSLMTGNKCINCHINQNGGGLRNELGWYSRKDAAVIKPGIFGLAGIYQGIDGLSPVLDNRIFWGFDFRLMSFRPGGSVLFDRKYFVMQATPYLALKPLDWLLVSGQFNFAKTTLKGQKKWSAFAEVSPSVDLPSVRFGFFRPPIGMMFDDHTFLTKMIAGNNLLSLIPADYSEYGAEVNYSKLRWLSITAGLFSAASLSENRVNDISAKSIPLVDEKSFSTVIKANFTPVFFRNLLNTNIGGSVYYNNRDNFSMLNLFAGVGLTDHVSVIAEFSATERKDLRNTENISAEIAWQVIEPLIFNLRAETALTEDYARKFAYKINQFIIGGKVFLLPYIVLQPEYRIFDNADVPSYSAQYAVQLHVFY